MSKADDSGARDIVALILRQLQADHAPIPKTAFGRVRRTAKAALSLAGSSLVGKGLSDTETVGKLVGSLGELKGIAMKAGQILSYLDDALPPETRRLLALLQTWSQPTPFAQIAATVRGAVADRAETLLQNMQAMPVAAASIGQVHRAMIDGRSVAVKVRHPGIDEAIRADFRAARSGLLMAKVLVPGADTEAFAAEAQARFLEECDYRREADHQREFAALFAGDPDIAIPEVLTAWSGDRVLTTSWCDGRTFQALLDSSPPLAERNRVARALYRFYVGTLYQHGLFNADPHPGNLLFADDGRVIVLDYGCVRRFDAPTVTALKALSRAVRADDMTAMRSALVALGARDPGDDARFAPTAALLRRFFGPMLAPGVHRITASVSVAPTRQTLADKRALARIRLPGKLLFLFRIRFGLYAVLGRLGAELDWRALEAELADS